MNSGASEISPIRRARRVQSSSLIEPARMSASFTFASADSRRMTISFLLISNENIAPVSPWWIAARSQGSPGPARRIVGRHHRLAGARYRWSGLSTCTQRTGTLGTGVIATIRRPNGSAAAALMPDRLVVDGEHVVVGLDAQPSDASRRYV